eukprot:5418715-Ditylum_brightwellii.AAC.1
MPYNKGSNLPLAYLEDSDEPSAYIGEAIELVVDDRNIGLTNNKKIFMQWHYKLAHYFLSWIQCLMQTGQDGRPPVIPTPKDSRAHCYCTKGLLCASCQYGKGAQRGSKAKYLIKIEPG